MRTIRTIFALVRWALVILGVVYLMQLFQVSLPTPGDIAWLINSIAMSL